MKAIIFYLFLTVSFLGANAQDWEFQNFKILKSSSEFNCFIIPLDFTQKFGLLQQEIIEKNFVVSGVVPVEYSPEETLRIRQRKDENDSIMRVNLRKRGVILEPDTIKEPDTTKSFMHWLSRGAVGLDAKEGIANPYPKEWIEVATIWAERLKGSREKMDLSIYVLVNNTGVVLSVYFELNAALLNFVREEDLQAVYDVVVKQPFYPDNFNFTRRDNKLVGEFMEKATNPKSNMGREERWAMAQEIDRKARPCVYGVLCFFRMKCKEKRQ